MSETINQSEHGEMFEETVVKKRVSNVSTSYHTAWIFDEYVSTTSVCVMTQWLFASFSVTVVFTLGQGHKTKYSQVGQFMNYHYAKFGD